MTVHRVDTDTRTGVQREAFVEPLHVLRNAPSEAPQGDPRVARGSDSPSASTAHSVDHELTPANALTVLHLGCGRKQLPWAELADYVGLAMSTPATVTHLDADPLLNPQIVCTLGRDPIPLPDDSVDVMVAWHVLEHIGRPAETAEWFDAWEEIYRVLKPGGWIYAECPYYSGIWAWSDPTHVRAISEHSFVFFMQQAYRVEGSMISPYRIRCDFKFAEMPGMPKGYLAWTDPADARNQFLRFALQAQKPLRPWWED